MRGILLLILLNISIVGRAAYILIPMDETQANHLKAYGIAYWILTKEVESRLDAELQGRKLHG